MTSAVLPLPEQTFPRVRRAVASTRWRMRTARAIHRCHMHTHHEIVPGESYWHENVQDVNLCLGCFEAYCPHQPTAQ